MLSISVIKNSAAAVSYYEKDDYYAANGGDPDAQGKWFGTGAQRLGLQGAVDREAFKAILEGQLPDGTTLGTIKGGERVHRPGWDLTFSAPKSVSVAAEVGGDERLFEAHDAATKEALTWLQHNAAAYRQRGLFNLRERESDNLVVALFQHDTSRNHDPQLHTHAIVANATQRPDGQWVSLHGDPLFDHKMAAGNVYRAALAAQVQQLGYEIERTHRDGRFELTAIPEQVAEAFASRREEIEKSLEARGMSGPEASARAAVFTRKAKKIIDRQDLQPDWQQQSEALGFDAPAAVQQARDAGDVTPQTPFNLKRTVAEAIDRVSEPEAVFTRAELVRWTLAGAMGRASVQHVEAEIARYQARMELTGTHLQGRAAWTTPKARDQEKRFLEAVARGRGAVVPVMRAAQVETRLASSALNDGQRAAVSLIATTPDRIVGVLGRPGTGKTFMLGEARTLLEAQGFTLKGMATNSEAARQISKDSGIESCTLHKHLRTAGRDLAALKGADEMTADRIRASYQQQVWVVDEASQLGSSSTRRLVYAAERLGARVVMIGDTQQLAAIDAGKPFDLMLKAGMKHIEMGEIRRQNNKEHVSAIRAVIAGDIDQAMSKLSGETREIAQKPPRLQAILDAWRAKGADRDKTFMLTAKNADKTMLNDGAREILRREGRLQNETPQQQLFRVFSQRADRIEAELYKTGDVVRFGRGVRSLTIGAGEYLAVVATDKHSNTVTLERPKDGHQDRIEWNPRVVAGNAKQGVELYRPRQTSVATGERIQWNRNAPGDLGLANGQVLTVIVAKPARLEVLTESGERKTIDTGKTAGQHWEHAYATTIYKSQGGTAKHVLVNAEASQGELFNQKAFLVAISRQKDSLSLFTDDTDAFTENVKRKLGEKTSATESREESKWRNVASYLEKLFSRFERHSEAPSTASGGGIQKDPMHERVQREIDR